MGRRRRAVSIFALDGRMNMGEKGKGELAACTDGRVIGPLLIEVVVKNGCIAM